MTGSLKLALDDAAGNILAAAPFRAMAGLVPLDDAIRAAARREIEFARAKYGDHFELLCIEGSWGDTIDDRKALQLLRTLNRIGTMYAKVICRV
jgi:hypothetical protein